MSSGLYISNERRQQSGDGTKAKLDAYHDKDSRDLNREKRRNSDGTDEAKDLQSTTHSARWNGHSVLDYVVITWTNIQRTT